MNKISVTVEIPLLESKYDVFIPIDKTIKVITKSLVDGINDLSRGFFPTNKKITIYSKKTGLIYDPNKLVIDTDLENGSSIVLI